MIRFFPLGGGLYEAEQSPALLLYHPDGDGTLSDLSRLTGCLIFCARPPIDPLDFAARLRFCWRDHALAIIWLDFPDRLADPGDLRGLRLRRGELIDRGAFRFRNYLVRLPIGSRVETAPESLVISGPPAYLYTDHGATHVATARGGVTIEASGRRPGRLRFDLELDAVQLDHLDAGIRAFSPAVDPELVDSLRFRVFAPGSAPLPCEALLHPLHPLRREGEKPDTLLRIKAGASVETFFRSPFGKPIVLQAGHECGLAFDRRVETLAGNASDAWYLTPWGTFAVRVDGEPFPALMASASGSEFIQGGFDGSDLNVTFRDGAAQARFHGGQATYFAQPAEQPFFQPRGLGPAAFLPTPVANLPDHPADTIPPVEDCVPLLPLAGVDPRDGAAALRLELRTVTPTRGARMKRLQQGRGSAFLPIPPAPAEPLPAVTSAGQLAEFSPDMSTWRRLVVTTGSDGAALALSNLDGPLRDAFLVGRRMTVISDPLVFAPGAVQLDPPASLNIAGWPFDLDPGRWFRDGTVLVFKDHADSLEDLVKRPDAWTDGQQLNLDPLATSRRILALAAAAEQEAAAGDADFAPFVHQIWRNPSWNGFLAFNAAVSPVGFPDDLAVLAGGLDPAQLRAHHIGVSSSAVERDELGAIVNGRGALFGLVNYQNDKPLADQGPYAWSVRTLRARFQNSRLENFQARIDLRVRELFGDRAAAPAPDDGSRPADTLVIYGHHEVHDGHGRYSFHSKDRVAFQAESGVLEEVVLDRASLETVAATRSPDDGRLDLQGRFLLSGAVKFRALPQFDVFSFDGLPVGNLALKLAFTVVAGAKEAPVSRLSFTIDQARIRPDGATPRPASLIRRFPLALDTLRALPAGGLSDLKLAQVLSPLPQTTRDQAGYVLEYRLDLGLGGAKSYVTVVWWPNGRSAALHLGLRIPGFDGSFHIVDDLITLGPKMIQFLVDPSTGETILLLRRIGIRVPLGLSLPPGGRVDAALFGDPAGGGGGGKIAWYAAWTKT